MYRIAIPYIMPFSVRSGCEEDNSNYVSIMTIYRPCEKYSEKERHVMEDVNMRRHK